MPAFGSQNYTQALLPGQSLNVWLNETPALASASLAVALTNPSGQGNNPKPISVEIQFNANPGAFEIDLQESDSPNLDGAFQNSANGAINAAVLANDGFYYARLDLPGGIFARAARLKYKTQGNVVQVNYARISR